MKENPVQSAPSAPGKSKLLSICMIGRDDDYMHDFRYRITTTIDYIARGLRRLGRLDEVEILVTDWGSQVPLAETLRLSAEALQSCRFVFVPPDVVRSLQDGREGFHMALAMNAGLRRASGRMLMVSPMDTLIPQHSLEAILKLASGELQLPVPADQAYFVCSRFQVPWHFVQHQPSLGEWERYLLLCTGEFRQEQMVLRSLSKGAGALLLHRSLWHKLRGFDERLNGWGMHDIELGLRVTQHHPWVELSSIGVTLLHMEHNSNSRRTIIKNETKNPRMYAPMFQVNDKNWGLIDYELEMQKGRNPTTSGTAAKPLSSPRRSDTQGLESWPRSRREVLGELLSKEIRDHVRGAIELFLRDRTWNWSIDWGDIEALFFLSWYSRFHDPRRYLEFGISRGYAAAAVATACPSIEVYGIDRWEGILHQQTPPGVGAILRQRACHHGHVRFINGDITTGLQRLRESFVGSFFLDLVFVRGDLAGAEPIKQVHELLAVLAPGGALVLSCSSADDFNNLWSEVRREFPHLSYFSCKSRKTGMILAVSFREDQPVDSLADDCLFETKPIWMDIHLHVWRLRWLYNAFRRPARIAEYIGWMCRWARQRMLN